MRRRLVLGAALVIATVTAGIAIAAGNMDGDESLSGPTAKRASEAALASTGGGAVLEVERGDDDGAAYEVEVRKQDGTVLEVRLDAGYNVLDSQAGDDDSGADDDSGGDDD